MSDVWSWQNYADSGTLTTNAGAATLLPLDNLRDPRPGKMWRGTASGFTSSSAGVTLTGFSDGHTLLGWGGTDVLVADTLWTAGELRCDFGQDRAVAVVGLFNTNLGSMTQVEFRLGTTPGGSDVWREGIDPTTIFERKVVRSIKHPTTGRWGTRTARYLTVAFTGAPPIEAGRLWAGPANWRPTVGHVLGSGFEDVDNSIVSITPRQGAFLIDRAACRRVFRANYDMISAAEYQNALRNMGRDVGRSRQILFVPSPDVHPYWLSTLGYRTQNQSLDFTGFLRAAQEILIQEAG